MARNLIQSTSWKVTCTLLLFLFNPTHKVGANGMDLFNNEEAWDFASNTEKECPSIMEANFPSRVKVTNGISSGKYAHLLWNNINSRSTSPWDYSFNQDFNRLPPVIAEAKCRHDGCVDSEGNVDFRLNSIPIRQEILVLRMELRGCTQVFKLEKQIITVGCTCAKPIVQYLN